MFFLSYAGLAFAEGLAFYLFAPIPCFSAFSLFTAFHSLISKILGRLI